MPSLFLDGAWTTGHAQRRDDVINPFDQSVVEAVDLADAQDVHTAVTAAAQAFAGDWPRTRRPSGCAAAAVADLLIRDKKRSPTSRPWTTGKTLVESRIDVDDVTAVFVTTPRWPTRIRPRGGHRPATRAQPGGLRAGRRVRADHAVELPAATAVLEGGPRAGRREQPW